MPMLGAWVAHDAPTAARGSYLGAYFASFSVGFVAAPLLGGWIYDELGADALWIACTAGGLLAAVGLRALARPPRGAVSEAAPGSSPPATDRPAPA
jgi:MFS family permease